ncbi:MAG: hypothetical protein KDA36_06820 [Planctomycetaceae bacterium]|nr:hypothetical protein [Planctomycetaceae bacterium]
MNGTDPEPMAPQPDRDEASEFEDYRITEGLIDFQALVREGDAIVYDLVSGTMQFNGRTDWWGQFQVPRNTPEETMPEEGRYYMLHLKDGRCGTMIVDRRIKNLNGRYPTIQFHGAGPLE